MNSTPSRYETVFGEQAVAPSPGFDIDETVASPPSGAAREYGLQIAQPVLYSHAGRPGIEYLVTAEYDEKSETIYDGKEIAEYVESTLSALFKSTSRAPEAPEVLKKCDEAAECDSSDEDVTLAELLAQGSSASRWAPATVVGFDQEGVEHLVNFDGAIWSKWLVLGRKRWLRASLFGDAFPATPAVPEEGGWSGAEEELACEAAAAVRHEWREAREEEALAAVGDERAGHSVGKRGRGGDGPSTEVAAETSPPSRSSPQEYGGGILCSICESKMTVSDRCGRELTCDGNG